jgi:hypothetical protein
MWEPRVFFINRLARRERKRELGQGDRRGGGPQAHATEGNAGPVHMSAYSQSSTDRSIYKKHPIQNASLSDTSAPAASKIRRTASFGFNTPFASFFLPPPPLDFFSYPKRANVLPKNRFPFFRLCRLKPCKSSLSYA